MAKVLVPLIVAFWVMAIALIAIQNATPISLRLLSWQTIQIPVGIVIALSVALGMTGMAFVLPLWQGGQAYRE